MKRPFLLYVLVILVLVLGSFSLGQAASAKTAEPQKGIAQLNATAIGGPWEAEIPTSFSLFKRFGWGTEVKAKAAGQYWVHISPPNLYIVDLNYTGVSGIEFCAKTSHPYTKPIRMDIWSGGVNVGTKNITWANNTNIQCNSVIFNPAQVGYDFTISVLLKFYSVNHKITLVRASIVDRYDY
jgi:hypothetical protein